MTIPHERFGALRIPGHAPDRCDCLNTVSRGDVADIVCGECGVLIRTLRVSDAERVLC
jgi:hypothetical protein